MERPTVSLTPHTTFEHLYRAQTMHYQDCVSAAFCQNDPPDLRAQESCAHTVWGATTLCLRYEAAREFLQDKKTQHRKECPDCGPVSLFSQVAHSPVHNACYPEVSRVAMVDTLMCLELPSSASLSPLSPRASLSSSEFLGSITSPQSSVDTSSPARSLLSSSSSRDSFSDASLPPSVAALSPGSTQRRIAVADSVLSEMRASPDVYPTDTRMIPLWDRYSQETSATLGPNTDFDKGTEMLLRMEITELIKLLPQGPRHRGNDMPPDDWNPECLLQSRLVQLTLGYELLCALMEHLYYRANNTALTNKSRSLFVVTSTDAEGLKHTVCPGSVSADEMCGCRLKELRWFQVMPFAALHQHTWTLFTNMTRDLRYRYPISTVLALLATCFWLCLRESEVLDEYFTQHNACDYFNRVLFHMVTGRGEVFQWSNATLEDEGSRIRTHKGYYWLPACVRSHVVMEMLRTHEQASPCACRGATPLYSRANGPAPRDFKKEPNNKNTFYHKKRKIATKMCEMPQWVHDAFVTPERIGALSWWVCKAHSWDIMHDINDPITSYLMTAVPEEEKSRKTQLAGAFLRCSSDFKTCWTDTWIWSFSANTTRANLWKWCRELNLVAQQMLSVQFDPDHILTPKLKTWGIFPPKQDRAWVYWSRTILCAYREARETAFSLCDLFELSLARVIPDPTQRAKSKNDDPIVPEDVQQNVVDVEIAKHFSRRLHACSALRELDE